MAEKIRCGIIGCGVIAPLHADCLTKQDNVEITWACDLQEDRLNTLGDRFNIPNRSTDYKELLADPELDAVHVCTDHASHSEISVAAVEAGKHVICEKAMAAHAEEMDAMIKANNDHPDVIFAGIFQHRFEPINRYLKRLIDEGAFGTLVSANLNMRCWRSNDYYKKDNWRGTWDLEGGGVLINQAIHFIDLLQWISGGVKSLCGVFENLAHQGVIEVEDTAVATLRYKNGALGIIEATSCTEVQPWEHTLSFHGTKGGMEIRNNRPIKTKFLDPDFQAKVEHELENLHDDPTLATGKVYYGPGHPSQIGDFIAAIREKRQPFVTINDAKGAVDLVLSIYQSAREGKWVHLP